MPNWLSPIRAALDSSTQPVRLFFRDDDVGWANDQLLALLNAFRKAQIPIDLAVIPEHLNQSLNHELLSRWRQDKQLLGLHQHGYSHRNHEPPENRKNEFGNSRNKQQQKADIAAGQAFLRAMLDEALDPIFTPPWNRCTQTTVECLEEMNFKLLSRDRTAANLNTNKIKQVPVHLDWSKIIKTVPDPLHEIGKSIADHFKNNILIGIMLHHADMDAENLLPLSELLSVLSTHPYARGLLMRQTIE